MIDPSVETVLACCAGRRVILIARDGISSNAPFPIRLDFDCDSLLGGFPADGAVSRMLEFGQEIARSPLCIWDRAWPPAIKALGNGAAFDSALATPAGVARRFRDFGFGRGGCDIGSIDVAVDRLNALRRTLDRAEVAVLPA